jgi:hypothetical protein
MNKIILFITVLFGLIQFPSYAQNELDEKVKTQILSNTDTLALKSLKEKLLQKNRIDKENVNSLIKANPELLKKSSENGKTIELKEIKNGRPVYRTTFNRVAAQTTSTDDVWGSPFNLDGSGIYVGLWDGGAVDEFHSSFREGSYGQKHVFFVDSTGSTFDTHATHVAGTIVADNDNYNSKGMASKSIVISRDWNADVIEMTNAASLLDPNFPNGIILSNHSYGKLTGWAWADLRKVGAKSWYWMAGNMDSEDTDFGSYNEVSFDYDQIAFNAPYYTIVWAVGNDRGEGPEANAQHYYWDESQRKWVSSTNYHVEDGGSDGYDCITPDGVAKNIITVGAIDDIINGYQNSSDVKQINTDFSSWGPTKDGRIKPDIVANGDSLYSTLPGNTFGLESGTSMAAPNVTGAIALLLQHYKNTHSGYIPLSSTIKAILIHTADESGDNPGPDYKYGWGLLNTYKAVQLISQDQTKPTTIQENDLLNGQSFTMSNLYNDGTQPIKITLVWNDLPPANMVSGPILMRDLDVKLIKGGVTYYPYKLNPASPSSAATTGDNNKDNVEQIFLQSPGAGYYTVVVSHEGTLSSTQKFSLITTGFIEPFVTFYLKQMGIDNQPFGQASYWDNSMWNNVPDTQAVTLSLDKHHFLSIQDFKPSTYEKFNRWEDNLSNKCYRNWDTLTLKSTTTQVLSKFIPKSGGTVIKNSFDNTNGSGGYIKFKDPWLTDLNEAPYGLRNRGMDALFKSLTSPFYPNYSTSYNGDVYKGVFLNQPYTGTNPVFYSVKVDAVQSIDLGGTIGTRDFYFQNWSANPPGSAEFQNADALETPVVFKSDGATVQANLKGHLFTNSPTATAPNNQRKIVQGSNGYWAMVYVSMDQIWLSRSTDGVNWEREIIISGGWPANCPHISISGNIANIIWQETNWRGGNGFDFTGIYLRSYNLSDNTLEQAILVDSFIPNSESFQATPVFDGEWSPSYTSEMFVWREPDGLKTKRYTNSYGWSSKGIISGTNSYSTNPSIADYNSSTFFICWEDAANQKIKYIEASYGPSWSFFSAVDISPSYWTENISPQMTLVGGNRPTIVWRSENNAVENGTSVNVRQRIGNTWQNITSFSQTTIESLNPVIGDYYAETKMDVLWNISNYVYKASFNGSSWSGPAYVTSSGGPSSINRKTDYQTKAVWQKIDNTIGFYTVGGTAPPAKTVANSENEEKALPYRLNRHAIIELPTDIDSTAKGSVCFEIAGINLIYNDSEEKINYSTDENNLLASEPFKVATQGMQLSFTGAIYGVGLELPEKFTSKIAEPLAKVVLKDSQTDKVLQNLWVNNPSMLDQVQDKTFGEFKKQVFGLDKYLGKTVYVDIEMIGKAKGIKPLLVDDYLILSDSNSIAKNVAQKEITGYELPTDYTLMQNFPNPFNPSTTIAFYLPKAEYTTLKIYNVLGKEVMTVVNENLGQGYHSIDINMSGEPSGVFFYSLSAGSFRDTKKILLLK